MYIPKFNVIIFLICFVSSLATHANDSLLYKKNLKNFNKSLNEQRFDSAYIYGKEIILLNVKLNDKENAFFFQNMGNIAQKQEKYSESVSYFKEAIIYLEKTNDKLNYAQTCATLGYLLYVVGEYEEAANVLLKNEKYCTKNNLQEPLANTYIGLGFVYRGLNAFGKGLEFFTKCLEIAEKININQYKYTALNEIGNIYLLSGEYENAITYQLKSIKIKEALKDTISLCYSYNDISISYRYLKKYEIALSYLNKCSEICIKYKYDFVLAAVYINISEIYKEQNMFQEAEKYIKMALELSKKSNLKSELSTIYYHFGDLMAKTGNFEQAYEYQLLHKIYADSLLNEGVHKQLNELAAKFEFDKKKKEIELLQKDALLKEKELKEQQLVRNTLIAGIFLFIVLTIVLINRYKIKHRANRILAQKNEEISQQKEEIIAQRDEIEQQRDQVTFQRDEIANKNKEIGDSIQYAQKIQMAILPDKSKLSEYFKDNFILFMPRDVVSGDFYWFQKLNNKIIITVADCTGHGVPGAFMSILGISALNEIINKQILQSNEILDQLKSYIINALHQTGKSGEMKDGMDLALCVIDKEQKTIDFAGANSPLWLIRKNKTLTEFETMSKLQELEEIKGDKMPLGIYLSDKPFTSTVLKYSEGDKMYLFTDGFKDQIGGISKKKIKSVNLKTKILEISSLEMEQQRKEITTFFNDWKESNEQIDDVLLMGIKLD